MAPRALRVAVATVGRFWTVDLALQLHAHGVLSRLYAAYPSWKLEPALRRSALTFPWVFGASRLLGPRLPPRARRELDFLSIAGFDRWTARRL